MIQRLQQGNTGYADNAPSNKDNLTDALSEPTAPSHRAMASFSSRTV
jgi:hypothetical protein